MPFDFYVMFMSPPCRTVMMVAKHLNIELNHKIVDLNAGEHLSPEYLKLNPAHTVPTIDDNGFVLFESRAIIKYLINNYAPNSDLYPSDPKIRALVDRTLDLDLSLFSVIGDTLIMPAFGRSPANEEQINAMKNNLKLFDTLIDKNKYLVGNNVTIADISVLATLTMCGFVDYDLSEYTNLKSWFDRLQKELPYFDEINGNAYQYFNDFVKDLKKATDDKK